MKLVTIDVGGVGRTGIVLGDEVLVFALAGDAFPLANWVPSDMISLIGGGEGGFDVLHRLVDAVMNRTPDQDSQLKAVGATRPLSQSRLLAPVLGPRLIISTGLAYREHAEEMRGPQLTTPAGSMRCASSVIGPDAPIVLPPDFPDMVDIEVELSVVIGSPCHRVSADEAMAYVAGYTLYNDVSARDWNESRNLDLVRLGKQFPTFSPLGPWIVTRDEIADPYCLDVRSTINGEILQQANTSGLLFSIAETIAYFSSWFQFLPGDVITTGSPGGVGYSREPKLFLRPGDVVTVEADGIGVLRNPVVGGGV